jgi:type VI secretion system secreted protein VgrG
MRPTPVIVVLVGMPPTPLLALRPERLETQHKVNAIPSARLVLSVEGDSVENLLTHQEEIALCSAGRSVEVWLHESGTDKQLIFRGVIAQQLLKVNRTRTELSLILRHGLQRLQNTRRSQVYDALTDAVLLNDLLLKQGVTPIGISGMNIAHEQLVQFRCSDWQFLRSRLLANGTWLFPAPEGVTIMPPLVLPVAALTLQQRLAPGAGQTAIAEAQWRFSVQEQPAALEATSWDDQAQSDDLQPAIQRPLGTRAFDAGDGPWLNDTTWAFNYSTSLSMVETSALASSLLMNLQAARATGEFLIDGTARLQLGQTVGVDGYGASLDGLGIVTGIHQFVSKEGGWRTLIVLGHQDAMLDLAAMPRATGLHVGVVAQFKKDPSGMNRLRVRLPVLGKTNNIVWARLAKPYASAMSGFCFYPEVGDEVVVGFFDEDPSYPVILGAMHNPVNPAPLNPDIDNAVKALVVKKDGHTFQLMFDTREDRMTLSTTDEKLTFHKGTLLESQTELTVKARKLVLTGDQSTVEGTSTLSLQGAKINLSH